MREIGFIGLGRMGGNLALHAVDEGFSVVGKARSRKPELEDMGVRVVGDYPSFVKGLHPPRVIYLSLPAGPTIDQVLEELVPHLKDGDVVMDGGNSLYLDSIRREETLSRSGIYFLDCGTSGGTGGARHGACFMVGGRREGIAVAEPVLKALAVEEGYVHTGVPGSGHYVKMIHNAVEYGMMQAIAEGFDLLANGSLKGLNLRDVAHVWNHGSIVASFLMAMAEKALEKDPALAALQPFVDDSGEGRWAVKEAIDHSVPFIANAYALNSRFASRDKDSMAHRMLAALRKEFGEHPVKKK